MFGVRRSFCVFSSSSFVAICLRKEVNDDFIYFAGDVVLNKFRLGSFNKGENLAAQNDIYAFITFASLPPKFVRYPSRLFGAFFFFLFLQYSIIVGRGNWLENFHLSG